MKFKRRLKNTFWFVLQVSPVLFALALHFVDLQALVDLVGDGSNFGFFGGWFVDFSAFFVENLSFYHCLLISALDWALTLSLLRVVYDLASIFTSWLYDVMDWRRKDE